MLSLNVFFVWLELIQFSWHRNGDCYVSDAGQSCSHGQPNIHKLASYLPHQVVHHWCLLHIVLLQMQCGLNHKNVSTPIWVQIIVAEVVAFQESNNSNAQVKWGTLERCSLLFPCWGSEMENLCEKGYPATCINVMCGKLSC